MNAALCTVVAVALLTGAEADLATQEELSKAIEGGFDVAGDAGEVPTAALAEAIWRVVAERVEVVDAILSGGRSQGRTGLGTGVDEAVELVRARVRAAAVEACDGEELARRNALKEANLLPGAPRGLPPCFTINWETLVADAWALLERGEFDDPEHVAELAAFGETGGFRAYGRPLERDVIGAGGDALHVNAPMDLSMMKSFYTTLRTEYEKGWIVPYKTRSDVPYKYIRVQPAFFVKKGDGDGGQKVKLAVDPADGVLKETLQWRLCEDARRSGLNVETSLGYELRRGSPGQLDDVRDAGEMLMSLKARGHKRVEMALVDESAAYRNYAVCDLDRPNFCLFGIDVTKAFPSESELDIDAKGVVHLRAEQCSYYTSQVLRFGWHRSVSSYFRTARLIKALHLSEGAPTATFVPRDLHEGARFIDDHLVMALEGWCGRSKAKLLELMARYNIPYSVEKDEKDGTPAVEKQFLGLILDSVKEEMRLSRGRLDKLLAKLGDAAGRSHMLRAEFASLVGLCSFAASCAPASRSFMRRMFGALKHSHGRFLRLNRGLKADLAFWMRFAPVQNGVSLLLESEWRDAEELRFWTDASMSGYGAAFELPDGTWEYFGGEWAEFGVDLDGLHISQLEMLAAAQAFDTWGAHLARRRVVTRCDNESSVYTINSITSGKGSTTDPGMMVVAREIFFICAKHSFLTRSKHIGTKLNVLADAASRGDWRRFFEFAESEFGVERGAMRRVQPTLDTRAMLLKMRKAVATERRLAEEGAQGRRKKTRRRRV